MPSYRTKQLDEQGKAIYQDVCYPVTKEFRAKLYDTILAEYEIAKNKDNSKSEPRTEARTQTEQREWTPFR
jgi:DNA-binding cell septation regulator SpoVG